MSWIAARGQGTGQIALEGFGETRRGQAWPGTVQKDFEVYLVNS